MINKLVVFTVMILMGGYSSLAWSGQTTISCNQFKGSQISVSGTGVDSVKDGYSGQKIMVHLGENDAEVEWSGPNSFKVPITFGGMSEAEGWIVWVQYHQEVYRTYTYFMKTKHLALTESQAQVFTGIPSVKTMLGRC